MFYKLSNTAEVVDMESAFDAKFKYPLLYQKNEIINGLSEQSLPILSKRNSKVIDFAIWGLLPQSFNEDWKNFQNINNTLNISLEDISNLSWIKALPNEQRCIILVTGYFTTFLHKGEIYPFYVHLKNNKPFAIAGIFSILNDGFLSFSIVTSKSNNQLTDIHNLGKNFPLTFSRDNYNEWFDVDINALINHPDYWETMNFEAHTISKEFYKNDIIYDSILEPAKYKGLPILSLKQ
ncbi:SOS response-associated peptidase family protein [Winogradskyella ursingii]|uniref:SOS response-associated peptidase family protein n=1 Tax=Winogradskyella ursingii TaxID=2686079 RepID=UPI0015C75979|nr:SOS response-associated peptidase family protein [Winogradskyella ursingii]